MAAAMSIMDSAKKIAEDNKINPFTQEYDESKGVAGRVTSLIDQNSPLMQTAATQGAQQAAKRGLLNSSTGVQAGQQAVINTATPIATADANLSTQTSLANLAAKNTAATNNAQLSATLSGQAMSLDNSNQQQGKSLGESARQADQNAALQTRQIDAQIAQFAQSLGMTAADLQIKRDTLTSNDKNTLAQLEFQKSQLAASTAQQQAALAENARQFNTSNANNLADLKLKATQIDAQISQFAQTLGLNVQDLQLRRDQLSSADRQALDTLNLQKQQLAQAQSQFESSQATNKQQFQTEIDQKQKQFDAAQTQQMVMQNLDSVSKEKIAAIQSSNQADISGNTNIANAWGTMMSGINSIQNNSALEQGAKQTLIQNTIDSFQSYAAFWKKATGGTIDVGDLLNFQVATTASGSSGGTGGGTGPGGSYARPGSGYNDNDIGNAGGG